MDLPCSGKTGVGASLQVRAPAEPCPVALFDARLEIAGRSVAAAVELPARRMGQGEVARAYLPFLFDNEASWNRGEQTGELVLRVVAGGSEELLRFAMTHQTQSFLTEAQPLVTVAPSVDPLEVKMIAPPAPAAQASRSRRARTRRGAVTLRDAPPARSCLLLSLPAATCTRV